MYILIEGLVRERRADLLREAERQRKVREAVQAARASDERDTLGEARPGLRRVVRLSLPGRLSVLK